MRPILRISDLSFGFDVHTSLILNHINLCISKNEIISVVGKSGCGKSTLLNLISGLLPIRKGSIDTSGLEISYLTQKPTLLSYRNSFENALLGLELRNSISDETREEIEHLFSFFGLDGAKGKYPHELSGGMIQRVGIIQSVLLDSAIYLLDEPFTAIDRNTLVKIENYLWELFRKKEALVILVNHDLEKAIAFSDRIIMLSSNPGTVVYDKIFAPEFSSIRPSDRKASNLYSDYFLDIVKNFSEL